MDSLHAKRRSILKEFRLKINLVPPLTSLYAGSLGKFLELVLDKSLGNKETSWRDFCKRRQSWPEGGQNWLEEACPEIVVCTVFDSGIEWVDIIVDSSSYTGLFSALVNFFHVFYQSLWSFNIFLVVSASIDRNGALSYLILKICWKW